MRRINSWLGSCFPGTRIRTKLASTRSHLLLVGALVFSCMPQSQVVAPEVAPSARLELAEEGPRKPLAFQLVHAAPKGPTSGDPAIHLIFSRPVKALGAEVMIPDGMKLAPSVPGHWEAVGSYGLTFVPDAGRLPRATAFVLEVPGDLKAADGHTLGTASSLEFETPRPQLSSAQPNDTWDTYLPGQSVTLDFSQPVKPQAVRPYLTVSDGESDLDYQLAQGNSPNQLKLSSKVGWPLAKTISYSIRTGYQGEEGPLGAQQSFSGSFRTYGPLTATVECQQKKDGSCRPEGGLRLELSNPVPAQQLARSIHAQGATLHVDRDWSSDAKTRHISISPALQPRSTITVSIDPIKDIYGQPLKWIKNRQLVVSDLRPFVEIGFSGELIEKEVDSVSILSTNASYELVTAKVEESQLDSFQNTQSRKSYEKLLRLPSARREKVAAGGLNEPIARAVSLNSISPSGAVLIGVSYQSEGERYYSIRKAQRTNLGVSVKRGREQSHVWVTDLSTGAPIAGARVGVVGNPQVYSTDARGLATLGSGVFVSHADKERPRQWLKVESTSDRSYRSSDETVDSWRIAVPTDFYGDPTDLSSLFPERDLFRPGESAWLKGYVRRPIATGNQAITAHSYSLELKNPDGDLVHAMDVKSNRFGAISAQVQIPGSAALGYWTVTLKDGDAHLASTHLQVAEFRPAEFKVSVRSSTPELTAGELAQFNTTAEYFYGGVMKRSRVEYTLARRPAFFKPPSSDSYETSDEEWQYHEPYRHYDHILVSEEAELNEYGSWALSHPGKLEHQVGPESLDLETTVHDLSGQTISSRGSAIIHPASYYVGIKRPESYLLDSPGTYSPKVKAITPEGASVAGRPVSLTLYRLHWTHARQQSGNQGEETVSELVRDVVGSCKLTTAAQDQSCELSISDSGHHIVRAASTDAQGRTTYASTSFYAVGGGRPAAWRDQDERGSVELTADRKLYRPGQTARILIKSPFEKARAWVTVERENISEQHLVQLSGPTPTVLIPITDKMRPNVYVGIHLLEDRKALGRKAHSISDSYRIGYTDLRIDPEAQRLNVAVRSNKTDYRPRDEVILDLSVEDAQGKAAKSELAVYVVDEGVLSLSGYQLPDPLEAFTGSRPLRVETLESRASIARFFGLEANQAANKGDPGGDGGDERASMLTTAYFNPSIETDARGQAQVRFKLPDNLGQFRVMVLAVTQKDQYGKGQSDFKVNLPLMVRPALPRFMRDGDELELSAVVSAFDSVGGEVRVEAETDGLQLFGPTLSTVSVPRGSSRLVSFKARTKGVGPVQIKFRAKGGVHQDSVSLERSVQSPTTLEAVALYGKTKKAEAFALGDLKQARKDRGGLDVTLSSSALVGLKGGFEYLWDYPYLCSEQLSSRILPSVMLEELASFQAISFPVGLRAQTAQDISQLIRRQRGNGGFGMWPESQESQPWVSAYALWVLKVAEQQGHVVGKQVFERGIRYLKDLAAARSSDQLSLATFSTFVLGKLGQLDENTVNALIEQLPQMDVESQTFLAWAAAQGQSKRAKGILLKRTEALITPRGHRAEITAPHGDFWANTFGTPLRLHAVALGALVALEPRHEMAAPLVRGLLDAREAGHWGSTQESAFALLALDAYRRAQEQEEPHFDALVFLGKKLLGQTRFSGRSTVAQEFSVGMKDLLGGGNLSFEQKGSGTLFFEARLKYAYKELPVDGLERGFLVKKTTTPYSSTKQAQADPKAKAETPVIPSTELAHGDLVVVELTVLVPTRRRYVVLDDPLPAGFEAIDMSQDTAQSSLSNLLNPRDSGYSYAWYRSELRDDRTLYFIDDMPPGVYRYRYLARATTRGKFIVPPTVAKEMYQEEVYGRTGRSEISIR